MPALQPGQADAYYRLRLFGAFSLSDSTGAKIDIRSRRAKAILAALAVSPDGECSRVWLQALLWGTRELPQAQNSLRKELSALRALLDSSSSKFVRSNRETISINLAMLSVDARTESGSNAPEFLEGFDIPGEEGFEDWLREKRSRYKQVADHRGEPEQAARADGPMVMPASSGQPIVWTGLPSGKVVGTPDPENFDHRPYVPGPGGVDRSGEDEHWEGLGAPVTPAALRPEYSVGLLVSQVTPDEPALTRFADMLEAQLCTAMVDTHLVCVHDLRFDGTAQPTSNRWIDLTLRVRVTAFGSEVLVQVILNRVFDRKVLLARRFSSSRAGLTLDFACQTTAHVVDQVCDALSRPNAMGEPHRQRAAAHALYAIDQMFRISGGNLDEAERAFATARSMNPRGPYFAWSAYLSAFRLEEGKGVIDADLSERTREFTARALEDDPWNPLSLALLSHVRAFVFRDIAGAFSLIEPALAVRNSSTMVEDTYALLNFYSGKYREAEKAALNARSLGSFSTHKYLFDTSLCMIYALMGKLDQATAFGERALLEQSPRSATYFGPTLRYLGAAHAHSGNLSRSRELMSLVRAATPDFKLKMLEDSRFPTPNQEALQFIIEGLSQVD